MDSLAADLREIVSTPVHDAPVAEVRRIGEEEVFPERHVVAEVRDPMGRFIHILAGEIEGIHPAARGAYLSSTLEPTRFTGQVPSRVRALTQDHGVFSARLGNGESFAASKSDHLSSRLETIPKVTVRYKAQIDALHGDKTMAGVTISKDGVPWELGTPAAFIMVGAAPSMGWLGDRCALDPRQNDGPGKSLSCKP